MFRWRAARNSGSDRIVRGGDANRTFFVDDHPNGHLTVPRIVPRALRGTSGITLVMGDGDASGCFRTSDSTDFTSARSAQVPTPGLRLRFGAPSAATRAEVGLVLNTLMPTQLKAVLRQLLESAAAHLYQAPPDRGPGRPELISMRITSWGTEGSVEAGPVTAGLRELPTPVARCRAGEQGKLLQVVRRCLRSTSGNRTTGSVPRQPLSFTHLRGSGYHCDSHRQGFEVSKPPRLIAQLRPATLSIGP